MNVVITGATGFIGTALTEALVSRGDHVTRLVRANSTPTPLANVSDVVWGPALGVLHADVFADTTTVVHLAGESIGEKKWTASQKEEILRSRTQSTELLAAALAQIGSSSPRLLSGSAIGYYGKSVPTPVDESAPPGNDFAANVCVQWEGATAAGVAAGVSTTLLRTGLVLAAHGGVLQRMLLPFKLGIGGRLGPGTQWMSWISMTDMVAALLHLIDHPVEGPVNLVSPHACTNTAFTKALGKALHRPTLLPTPLLPLRVQYGSELVETLLLSDQNVIPRALLESGFSFTDTSIEGCFSRLFHSRS